MIKWLIGIVAVVLVAVFLWYAFLAARGQVQEGGLSSLFTGGLFAQISEQTTSGIGLYGGQTEAPLVTLDDIGEFSTFYGRVIIEKDSDAPGTDDVLREHILLRAQTDNTQPINITGWSLQSMVTDTRVFIPEGVLVYAVGEVNETSGVNLFPGEEVVISSVQSPVGVSFRTNMCTGYLGSVQEFYPQLDKKCPMPASILPPTLENIRTYGDACVEFAAGFGQCQYLSSATEGYWDLAQECREYLQPALTYTSCVFEHKSDPLFANNSEWRVFLGSAAPLWKEKYEVIRLLDENSKTVDVFAY
jgi:hypothetical protein